MNTEETKSVNRFLVYAAGMLIIIMLSLIGLREASAAALKPVEKCWTPSLEREDGTVMTHDEMSHFLITYSKDQVNWADFIRVDYVVPTATTHDGLQCIAIDLPSSGLWYFAGFQVDTDGLESVRSNIVSEKVNARPKPQLMK